MAAYRSVPSPYRFREGHLAPVARHNLHDGPRSQGSSQLAIYEPYTVQRLRLASVVALSNA